VSARPFFAKENTFDVAGEVNRVTRIAMMEFAEMQTTTGVEGQCVPSVAGLDRRYFLFR